jgi:DNA-binding GntR family transcriptional regulator
VSRNAAEAARRTVAEEVYQALKRDIITLVHPPGSSLTELELARLYGSSRVPVREACRRLDQDGLLVGRPYRGYTVTPISLKEIGDCFDIRLGLETHGLRLAAQRAADDELEAMEELAATEYSYHDWASYVEFLDRNLEFHLRLIALSRNDRLVSILNDLLSGMQRYFFLGLDLGDFASEMRLEHEELIDLLKRDDPQRAVECLEQQIELSRRRILRALIEDRVDLPLE